jgi:hypothetical protein
MTTYEESYQRMMEEVKRYSAEASQAMPTKTQPKQPQQPPKNLGLLEHAWRRVQQGAMSEKAFDAFINRTYGNAVGRDEQGRLTVYGKTLDPVGFDWGEIYQAIPGVAVGAGLTALTGGAGASAAPTFLNAIRAGSAAGALEGVATPALEEIVAGASKLPQRTLKELFSDMGLQGIVGTVLGGGLGGAFHVAGAAPSKIYSTYKDPRSIGRQLADWYVDRSGAAGTPSPEDIIAAQSIKNMGVKNPVVSAVTSNPGATALSKAVSTSPSGVTLRNATAENINQASSAAKKALRETVGMGSARPSTEQTGKAFFAASEAKARRVTNEMQAYSKEIDKALLSDDAILAEIPTLNAQQAIQSHLNKLKAAKFNRPEEYAKTVSAIEGNPVFGHLLSSPKDNPSGAWDMLKELNRLIDEPFNQTEAEKAAGATYLKGAYINIRQSLKKDILQAADSGDVHAKALKTAMETTGEMLNKRKAILESPHMLVMKDGAKPQKLVQDMFSSEPDKADLIKKGINIQDSLRKEFGEGAVKKYHKSIMEFLITKAGTATKEGFRFGTDEEASASLVQLGKQLLQNRDVIKDVVFKGKPKQKAVLDEVLTTLDGFTNRLQLGNSQTQPLQEAQKDISIIGSAVRSPVQAGLNFVDRIVARKFAASLAESLADGNAYLARAQLNTLIKKATPYQRFVAPTATRFGVQAATRFTEAGASDE